MNIRKLKVVEIFHSIEGEGKRTGERSTFIRLYGCNLRCSYCDTPYGYEGNEYSLMSTQEILEEVKRVSNGCKNITITGGEPLLHMNFLHELIEELQDYQINIETNGSQDIVPYLKYKNVFFTMDYKSISSGASFAMYLQNYELLRERDVVKFVVGTKEDLLQMKEVINSHKYLTAIPYVSPIFGKIEPSEIVDFVVNDPTLCNVRVQIQIHKIIWDKDKRGV